MRLVSEVKEAMAHTDLYVLSRFSALASSLRPNGHMATPSILFQKYELMLTLLVLKSKILDRVDKYAIIIRNSP